MIVKILVQLLEKYSLCENGILVQFVSHKNGSFWSDEIYEDAIHVIPIDKDGNANVFRGRYFHCNQFKDVDKRFAFKELCKQHNIMTEHKRFGVPVYIKGNYCTIK